MEDVPPLLTEGLGASRDVGGREALSPIFFPLVLHIGEGRGLVYLRGQRAQHLTSPTQVVLVLSLTLFEEAVSGVSVQVLVFLLQWMFTSTS